MDTITIDLPGRFCDWFEGSTIVQENPDTQDFLSYAGPEGVVLRKAWDSAQKITRGKGYSYRLTLAVDDQAADTVDLLRSYAETCLPGARDNQDYAEADAAIKVINRCDFASAKLEAK